MADFQGYSHVQVEAKRSSGVDKDGKAVDKETEVFFNW